MLRSTIVAFLLALTYFGGPRDTLAADQIREQLDKAKAAYSEEIKNARESLLTDVDLRIESAQKAGDLDWVKKLRSERELLADSDVLPRSISIRQFVTSIAVARQRLKAAYLKAIREYTKSDKIKDAELIDKELQAFLEGGRGKARLSEAETESIGREVWVHDTGYFAKGIGQDWFEKYANGSKPPNLLIEIARTKEYVELQNRHAKVTVRLYEHDVQVRDDLKSQGFKTFYTGGWLEFPE